MDKALSQTVTPARALTLSALLLALVSAGSSYILASGASLSREVVTIPSNFSAIRTPASDMTALVERPLFSKTRRRSIDAPRKTSTAAGLFIPKGTSITARSRSVVLAGPDGPVVMREGEERDGVVVVRVEPNSVELEINGKRSILPIGSL